MSELATIVGTLSEITEKTTGWTEFSIAVPGKEYPVKLATKRESLIQEARETGGQVATWHYTESESSSINPHTNRPYVNRYLEGVEAGATATPTTSVPAGGNSVPERTEEPVDWDNKERRDFRSRAWAHTISAFNHTIRTDEDPKEVFLRLQPFQRLVYEDICQRSFPAWAEDDVPF